MCPLGAFGGGGSRRLRLGLRGINRMNEPGGRQGMCMDRSIGPAATSCGASKKLLGRPRLGYGNTNEEAEALAKTLDRGVRSPSNPGVAGSMHPYGRDARRPRHHRTGRQPGIDQGDRPRACGRLGARLQLRPTPPTHNTNTHVHRIPSHTMLNNNAPVLHTRTLQARQPWGRARRAGCRPRAGR